MKVTDVNAFKGQLKDVLVEWAGGLIDQMLPSKVTARVLFKNVIGNAMGRIDGKLNELVDTAFLMFGDSSGVIDTDSMVDMLCSMLSEMKPTDYSLGMLDVTVGGGEIKIKFPHNIFSDLIVGDLGGARITSADIKELKNYF